MEHKLATDQVKEQAALYALGALSQIEARAFENHLADGCEVCKAEIAEFDGVVGVLGLGAPPASPPAHLRELLMTRVAKEPRNIRSREGSPARATPAAPPLVQRRSPWITALPWAVAACLAIVAVSSVLSLRRVITSTNQELTSTNQELAQMRSDILHVNQLLVDARQRETEHLQVISVLDGPGAAHIYLVAQKGAPPSKADAYLNRKQNRLVIVADMPAAPPGKVYQLWFLAPDPKSAGLIPTDQSGHGFAGSNIPADLGNLKALAITLEPEGGSAQPTMPIYASGSTE